MAVYKMTHYNEKRKKTKVYTYDDFTNVQLVISLIALAITGFIYVTQNFFPDIAELKLLRYFAYACLPILAIIYVNKVIEKKDSKRFDTFDEKEKNRFAKLIHGINIVSVFPLINLGTAFELIEFIISLVTLWTLMIKPLIEKCTFSKEECNQISFIFFTTIVFLTAIQLSKML